MLNLKFPITKQFDNGQYCIFNPPTQNGDSNRIDCVEIEDGYLYALYANNGVGKTTFMNMLSLLTNSHFNPWTDGKSIFFGQASMDDKKFIKIDTGKKSLVRYEKMSFIFQDPHIINIYTIEENLSIVNSLFDFDSDVSLIKDKVQALDLTDYVKKLVITKLNKIVSERKNTPYYLSGGEKQLLSFIRCMIKPSNIIFADEPWASMDNHLKQFIESQMYLYISDKDIFSDIRNRNSDLLNKKIVMIISHPTHHLNNTKKFGKEIEDWKYEIPVSNKVTDDYKNLQVLTINKYESLLK